MKSLLNKNITFSNRSSEVLQLVQQSEGLETITNRQKVFSTADLWNIQRQVKYRQGRRFL